jgi:nicotinamidase-related amidase
MTPTVTKPDTALLVMDIQDFTVNMMEDGKPLLANLQRTIQTARTQNLQVIFVVVGFRKGCPEINPNNKVFSMLRDRMKQHDPEAAHVHPALSLRPDDIVVVKKRVSAFTGSDLEVVLRSLNIRHIVLTGIATSGVVLSTLREAADKDYVITVLSDCCADSDEEVHRVLMQKVFPRQAGVMTSDEWGSSLSA